MTAKQSHCLILSRDREVGQDDWGYHRGKRSEQAQAWSGLPVVTIRPTVFLGASFLFLLLVEKCLQRLANEVGPTLDTALSAEGWVNFV